MIHFRENLSNIAQVSTIDYLDVFAIKKIMKITHQMWSLCHTKNNESVFHGHEYSGQYPCLNFGSKFKFETNSWVMFWDCQT